MMVAFPIRMTLKQAKWETQKAKGEKRKFKQHEDGVFFFVRLSRLNKTQNLVRRLRQQDTSAFFFKKTKNNKGDSWGKKKTH